ncbi:hypothetical protein R3P38DRAFT_3231265 [Favolaschia claudopus]|uniref:Mitochondrial chaperone BCS1-like ATPase lid domain-containing protein n=1 Tax=Favolaschia claudopus TaxID=2862362 RepID=A0AAV9ZKW9_9AGAR
MELLQCRYTSQLQLDSIVHPILSLPSELTYEICAKYPRKGVIVQRGVKRAQELKKKYDKRLYDVAEEDVSVPDSYFPPNQRLQIEQVFKRFYPVGFDGGAAFSVATYTQTTVEECALKFAQTIPARMYSIAQIQGYLLTKKMDPVGALEGVDAWLKAQDEEKRMINELKDKRKAERAEKLILRRGKVAVAVALTDKAREGS